MIAYLAIFSSFTPVFRRQRSRAKQLFFFVGLHHLSRQITSAKSRNVDKGKRELRAKNIASGNTQALHRNMHELKFQVS